MKQLNFLDTIVNGGGGDVAEQTGGSGRPCSGSGTAAVRKLGDVLSEMENAMVLAQMANDHWWRGCKWDD